MRADQATAETSDDEKLSDRKLSLGSSVSEQTVLRSADERSSIAPSVQRQETSSSGVRLSSSGPDTRGEYEQRYGVSIDHPGQADRLQRLEMSNSLATVQRWADEGLPIEAMGTPSKMDAYRKREGTPVPWNAEQQNKQSLQRSKRAAEDTSPAGETNVPESVRDVVSSPGKPINTALRKPVESEIGQSLDHARVHRSPAADAACKQLNARAFTVNNHVAVRSDQPDPSTPAGQHLMSHELTHVAQQTGSAISLLPDAGALEVDPDPQLEQEAEETAQRVMQGGELGIQRLSETDVHVQRTPDIEEGGVSSDQANSTTQSSENVVKRLGKQLWEVLTQPRRILTDASAGYISAWVSEIQELINRWGKYLLEEEDGEKVANKLWSVPAAALPVISLSAIWDQGVLRRDRLRKDLRGLAGDTAVEHWVDEIVNEVSRMDVPNQSRHQKGVGNSRLAEVMKEAFQKGKETSLLMTLFTNPRKAINSLNRVLSYVLNIGAGLLYDNDGNESGLFVDTGAEIAGMAEDPTPLKDEVRRVPVPTKLKRRVAKKVRKDMRPSSATTSPNTFEPRSLDGPESADKKLPLLPDIIKWAYTMFNWVWPKLVGWKNAYTGQAVVDSGVDLLFGEVFDYLQLATDLDQMEIPNELHGDLVERVSAKIKTSTSLDHNINPTGGSMTGTGYPEIRRRH